MKYQNHQYQLTKDMDLLIQLIKNRLAHVKSVFLSHNLLRSGGKGLLF